MYDLLLPALLPEPLCDAGPGQGGAGHAGQRHGGGLGHRQRLLDGDEERDSRGRRWGLLPGVIIKIILLTNYKS